MIKGWKKLTAGERKHLSEQGCNNTAAFQRIIDAHAVMRKTSKVEPCWACSHIAAKLGLVANKTEHF